MEPVVIRVYSSLSVAGRNYLKMMPARSPDRAERGKLAPMVYRFRYGWILFSALLPACAPMDPRPAAPPPPPEPAVETEPAPAPAVVRLAAVGDIMLGGKAAPLLEREGYGYPFATTRDILTGADLAIGNLETALTDGDDKLVDKQYRFRNPPHKVAPALAEAGFDIVSLANNHTLDYGYAGLRDTLAALERYGIRHHGAGGSRAEARRPVVFELAGGRRAGFLAYSNTFPREFWAGETRPGTAFGHQAHVRADVAALAERGVEVIVVSFHWGRERQTELRDYQPLLARTAIDAGADLVIGHHPHILQGVERYKDGVILYSLGNFAFGSYSPHVHTSAVAEVIFEDGRFRELVMTPLNINNFEVEMQPRVLEGASARAVFDELDRISRPLGTDLKYRDGRIYLFNEIKPNHRERREGTEKPEEKEQM